MLKNKCDKSAKTLVCSLVFDEISLREKVDYSGDKYCGFVDFGIPGSKTTEIANKALVCMLVCINELWKVPVAYFFINPMDSTQKAGILQVYRAVIDCGLVVSYITFDGCLTNSTMCNLLGAKLYL